MNRLYSISWFWGVHCPVWWQFTQTLLYENNSQNNTRICKDKLMLNMKLSQILKLKFTHCRQLWNLSLDFPLSCTIFSYQNMEICTTVHIFDQRHDQTHANRPLKQATLDVEMWLYVANVIDDIKIIVDICSYLFNSLFIRKYLVISLCDWNCNLYYDTFWSY